ncbi:MAG: hypothetical protein JWQ01_4800 [Massilia sp.]|nr:hypothetical protein [Massilia sp.]
MSHTVEAIVVLSLMISVFVFAVICVTSHSREFRARLGADEDARKLVEVNEDK